MSDDITTKQGNVIVRKLERKTDSRGWLLKLLMRHHMENEQSPFGEIYLTAALPGEAKGNHFHRDATEWFCIIQGTGRLVTKDMATGEESELIMPSDAPVVAQVPPNVAHAIENVGQDLMVLLAYANEPYDPGNPDEVRTILVEPKQRKDFA